MTGEVVAGAGVAMVVPTGCISAWVGLVHPANSAQKKSATHAAAMVLELMNIPFILGYF